MKECSNNSIKNSIKRLTSSPPWLHMKCSQTFNILRDFEHQQSFEINRASTSPDLLPTHANCLYHLEDGRCDQICCRRYACYALIHVHDIAKGFLESILMSIPRCDWRNLVMQVVATSGPGLQLVARNQLSIVNLSNYYEAPHRFTEICHLFSRQHCALQQQLVNCGSTWCRRVRRWCTKWRWSGVIAVMFS